jgi:hypothetical protein
MSDTVMRRYFSAPIDCGSVLRDGVRTRGNSCCVLSLRMGLKACGFLIESYVLMAMAEAMQALRQDDAGESVLGLCDGEFVLMLLRILEIRVAIFADTPIVNVDPLDVKVKADPLDVKGKADPLDVNVELPNVEVESLNYEDMPVILPYDSSVHPSECAFGMFFSDGSWKVMHRLGRPHSPTTRNIGRSVMRCINDVVFQRVSCQIPVTPRVVRWWTLREKSVNIHRQIAADAKMAKHVALAVQAYELAKALQVHLDEELASVIA